MANKKEFKNDFSWSFSRDNVFNTCKRKYYYSYYGSWGGWNKDADELSKKLYMLNKMTSLPMLAGSIVHDEVERTLKVLRYGRKADIDKSKENVIKNFKQSWAQSKNKEWKEFYDLLANDRAPCHACYQTCGVKEDGTPIMEVREETHFNKDGTEKSKRVV